MWVNEHDAKRVILPLRTVSCLNIKKSITVTKLGHVEDLRLFAIKWVSVCFVQDLLTVVQLS